MKRLRDVIDGAHINRFRFWVQIACFLLIMYGGKLGLDWGRSLPVLSCAYGGFDNRLGICYLRPLQAAMSWPPDRLFSAAGWTVLTGFLLFAGFFLVLNRA